jgi:hypothetical protein
MKHNDVVKGQSVIYQATVRAKAHRGVVVEPRARNQFMNPEDPDRVKIILDGGERPLYVKPRQLSRPKVKPS